MKRTVLLLLFALPFFALGQELPLISSKVDTAVIRIGEQAKLHIEVVSDGKELLRLPEFSMAGELIEILPPSKIDTVRKKRNTTYKFHYPITSFDAGQYEIPEIGIALGRDTLYTEPFTLSVLDVEVDTLKQAVFGIKPVKKIPYTLKEIWLDYWWILPVLALIALAVWEFIKLKKRRAALQEDPIMRLSPYERAKSRLVRLDDGKLAERGEIKEYYQQLTDVVRMYFDEQFALKTMEQTTDEILASASKELHLRSKSINMLRELLSDADLVKFAKMYPTGEINRRYREYAEIIIDRLKPAEENQAAAQKQDGEKTGDKND